MHTPHTKFAPSTVVATAEDGFFLDTAITVLYGNEEAFLFLADRRNIIIHLKLNIKLLKVDYFNYLTSIKQYFSCRMHTEEGRGQIKFKF
jgi:hypothetical protein